MLTKKLIEQARRSLAKYRGPENDETKVYLNVLDSGYYVEVKEIKRIILNIADAVLKDVSAEITRHGSRHGFRHGSRRF